MKVKELRAMASLSSEPDVSEVKPQARYVFRYRETLSAGHVDKLLKVLKNAGLNKVLVVDRNCDIFEIIG